MGEHGTAPVKKATMQQVLDLQHEFGRVFQNIPFDTAKRILGNKTQIRRLIAEICKKIDIPTQSENILAQIPLLEKYYQKVYGIKLDLFEIAFPDNPQFPVIMVDDLSQDEDQIMDCIRIFFNKSVFNKSDGSVNLYEYMNPVALHINREAENKQVRQLQSGLVVFAHTGQNEPDSNHREKSYNVATAEGMQFMKFREYLRATGFHKYTKEYFMDKKGWTRTSSLWANSYLVVGDWGGGAAGLCARGGDVDDASPDGGPRELFQ